MGAITTRRLTIELEVRRRSKTIPATLDTTARVIEEGLAADPTLGARGKQLRLERTELTYSVELELPDGVCTMVYSFLYAVDPADMSEYKDAGS